MALNKQQMAIYRAGYRQGMYAATEGSKARTIVRRDLVHIYGEMILSLHEMGWSRDEIEDLVTDIQNKWVEECEEAEKAFDAGEPMMTIEDKVREKTGIDLVQIADDLTENN